MYFVASLVAALIVTVFLVSKIAKMLHAKRPDVGRVLLASLLGIVFAMVSLALIGAFVKGVEPMMMLTLSVVVVLIVSSAAFKYINQMSWSSAITTNIANVALSLMTLVAAVVLNGKSLDETISVVSSNAKDQTQIIGSVAKGEMGVEGIIAAQQASNEVLEEDSTGYQDEELEPVITEKELLPPGAIRALDAAKKITYVEPKFRVVSIGSIHSAVGQKVRILRKNGSTVLGSLSSIRGNDAVILSRLTTSSGEAVIPVSIARIRKLEVYR